MPRKIRELLKDYHKAGADIDVSKGKGSHRKVKHPKYSRMIIVSGKDSADAKSYQERDLATFLNEIKA